MNTEQEKVVEEEKQSISSPPTMHSPPLSPLPSQFHHHHKPTSPPKNYSPTDSPIISDHASPIHKFSPVQEHKPPIISDHASPIHKFSPIKEDKDKPPVVAAHKSVRDEPTMLTTKVEVGAQDGFAIGGEVKEDEEGGGGRKLRPNLSILRRVKRESMMKRVSLGFRVCGFVFCLVSFSVMAADKNQGWTLDSFDRYKELRYCMAVNVIGFAYSGLQAYDLVHQFSTSKRSARNQLRYYLVFFTDQILSYLLISASSSAATRVEDWRSNWGKDKFPDMAHASVTLSFLAFVAFAFTSLLSGYSLCTLKS